MSRSYSGEIRFPLVDTNFTVNGGAGTAFARSGITPLKERTAFSV